ncbi:mannosyltransferase putative [Entamoeba histolytica]|uniref:GPI mannosyltransferase 1 n=4 Tax=Entamoeba histolytica TaxID=5759 RepID=C4M7V9_ENTH1|nr:mannosyltransferase, putative [Entamoeba histolytica HM-1:IMSS]EAL44694.1 mannosyltransferase, putative [Entamoeba histolytica HM-1:IMSS]GAT97643.1 mannosyltransferase putative [Entamoeba histolytica]|eukprot:XP_650080.1 mannosyltransferase, putative [Entamoeba histolytica HM-1:IMSS]
MGIKGQEGNCILLLKAFGISLFFLSALGIRMGLIVYGMYQDQKFNVRYTDIDYDVYNDASRYLVNGESPYRRATYRYTPLLAEILIPDILLNEQFGKILFSIFDIIIACIQFNLLRQTNSFIMSLLYTAIWAFNPMSIVISTRGNAEAVVCLFVILTFYFLYKRKIWLCSLFFGLSIHMKIYPVLYSLPLFFCLSNFYPSKSFFTKERLIAVFGTAFVLIGLTGYYYYRYGFEFLWETYLYHGTRTDHRHNLSVYWYYLSLSFDFPKSTIRSLISFLPQIFCLIAIGFRYCKKDIIFCCYLMTCIFVAFNKVYTMQYFIWWFVLLPFVVPKIIEGALHHIFLTIFIILQYIASYGIWLYYGYELEFKGKNSMFNIFIAGIIVFIANIILIIWHIYVYSLSDSLRKQKQLKLN